MKNLVLILLAITIIFSGSELYAREDLNIETQGTKLRLERTAKQISTGLYDNSPRTMEKITGVLSGDMRNLLYKIQESVRAKDGRALVALITDSNYRGAKKESIINNFDETLSKEWQSKVLGQNFDDLFYNWKGVMVGNGQIWIANACIDDYCNDHETRIITINTRK